MFRTRLQNNTDNPRHKLRTNNTPVLVLRGDCNYKKEAVDIVHGGTSPLGASTSGQWDFAAQARPKMTGSFLSPEGVSGEFTIQLVPKGSNAMVFRVGAQRIPDIQMMRNSQVPIA
ncbi:MAG: hypothetical protein AB8B81_22730 [Halioglobus sp.]